MVLAVTSGLGFRVTWRMSQQIRQARRLLKVKLRWPAAKSRLAAARPTATASRSLGAISARLTDLPLSSSRTPSGREMPRLVSPKGPAYSACSPADHHMDCLQCMQPSRVLMKTALHCLPLFISPPPSPPPLPTVHAAQQII